jgi:hypothetical protein
MFRFLKEYRVYLKNDTTINFPIKCIVCGELCIKEKKEIDGYYENYSLWFFERWKRYFSANPKICVPIHRKCDEILNRKTTFRNTILIVVFIASLGINFLITNEIDRWSLVISLIPSIIAHYTLNLCYYPEPIRFTKDDLRTRFVFGNENYTMEFKKLNKDNLFDAGKLLHPKRKN